MPSHTPRAANGMRRQRIVRLAALALFMYANVQSTYGQPSVLTSASTETLHDLVEAFVKQQTQSGRAPAPGYVGVHPLPRSNEILVQRQDLPVLQTAAVVAAATNAAVSTQSQQATSVQASSLPALAVTTSASQAPAITPATKSSSPSTSSSPSSSSTSSASSTNTAVPSNQSPSIFSPQNKLFPAAIAIGVAIGLGALLLLISIGKCYSHRQMAREEREGTRKYKSKDSSILTADYGMIDRKRTLGKSLKRAFTRGKLGGGSFARRHREGTVLIDVGDEVLAVAPEVAREYERERKAVMSSYQSNSGSGGTDSRLTFPANQPTPSRQALYNAQLIVAANKAEASRGGKPQAPRGFDINSWRNDSALPGLTEDDEKTLNGDAAPLRRGLSKRLADGFRALTGGRGDEDEELGEPKTSQSFSFESEKQFPRDLRQAQAPLSATVPVMTRGSGGWAIQRNEGNGAGYDQARTAPKYAHKPMVKQASDSTLRDSALSHDRVTLQDDGPANRPQQQRAVSANVVRSANENGGARPKSILIKRSQDRLRQQQAQQQETVGTYRNRTAQFDQQALQRGKTNGGNHARNVVSTSSASAKTFHQRSNTMVNAAGRGDRAARVSDYADKKRVSVPAAAPTSSHNVHRKPIVLKPETPLRVANGSASGHSDGSNSSRDLYRPLPPPPRE